MLIKTHLGLILKLCKKFKGLDDWDELVQVASIACWEASKIHDPKRGKFSTIATLVIERALRAHVTKVNGNNRGDVKTIGITKGVIQWMEHNSENGKADLQEVANYCKISLEEVKAAVSSFNTKTNRHVNIEDVEIAIEEAGFPENVERMISTLDEDERKLVSLRFGINCREMKLKEIGDILDLSSSEVAYRLDKALAKLR